MPCSSPASKVCDLFQIRFFWNIENESQIQGMRIPANLSHDDVVACAGCKSVRIPSYRISTALNKAQDAGGSWRGSFSTVATVLHNTIGEKSLQLLWETRRHPLPIPFDTRPLMLLVGITPEQGSSEKHPAVVLFSHYCMHYWYRPHLKHVFKRATIFAISISYMYIICTKTTQTIPQIPQTHCGANRTPNTSHQAQAQTTRTHCKCCGNDRAHQDHNIELSLK